MRVHLQVGDPAAVTSVSTVDVNGIRAATAKGMAAWLSATASDGPSHGERWSDHAPVTVVYA